MGWQTLDEVGMAFDVWAARTSMVHRVPAEEFLYVLNRNRKRLAQNTVIYALNREASRF
ncbi:MAG: hypothetical protein SynsKO_00030 [Synoicihabitans sp.]